MQNAGITIYGSKGDLEKARALQAAQSSYTERFYMLMKLIKVSEMIRKAKIIQSPVIPNQ